MHIQIKKLSLTLACLLGLSLSGCAVHDGSNQWNRINGAVAPTKDAPYGVIVTESFNGIGVAKSRMRQLCAPYGGLNESSITPENARFGEDKWSYSCYGTARISAPQQPSNNYVTPQQPSNITPQNSNLTIENAKKKCSDLGFKAGTEGFGKCVLQLSK